jgi:hypothetical protein
MLAAEDAGAGLNLNGLCLSMHGMRRSALLVALAAMVLRALLPAGMMVAPESGKIVICTGRGAVERPVDQPGKPTKAAAGICLFAAQASAAPPPSLAVVTLTGPVLAEATIGRPQAIIPGRGLAAPPPPAQAPPTLI